MRQQIRLPNAIDFWRGFALINIFLSHIPGNAFERLTHRHYSLSDAELFVFLAGWSMRLANGKSARPRTLILVKHSIARVARLYKAQLGITIAALAILLVAAAALNDQTILQWGNAGAVVDDPQRAVLGLALLTHQLQYFDIMPLYIVLSAAVPLFVLLNRRSPWLLLACSATIWAAASTYRIDLPTWPIEGHWFFNPLAWQLPFVLGFVLAGDEPIRSIALAWAPRLFWPSLAIALAGGYAVAFRHAPDAVKVDFGFASMMFSKTYVGPARFVHFIAMLIACLGVYPLVSRYAQLLARVSSLLGRNALPVFVAASLLSLVGRILKHVVAKGIEADLAMVVLGISVIVLTAWVHECRQIRHKHVEAAPSSPSQPLQSASPA
jgi:hypothetical protein